MEGTRKLQRQELQRLRRKADVTGGLRPEEHSLMLRLMRALGEKH